MPRLALLPLLLLWACNGGSSEPSDRDLPIDEEVKGGVLPDSGEPPTSLPDDAEAVPPNVDKAAACASTFGSSLTSAFGRIDGTVVAVVKPGVQCPMPNGDHVVVQVLFGGEVYRMVVNVESSFGDPRIRYRTTVGALPSPTFAEGWHPNLSLDYLDDLGAGGEAGWEALTLEEASERLYDAVELGSPISVYATSGGGQYAMSAHKIHRNGQDRDGALVLNPTSPEPTWLLFKFANQAF